MTTLDRDPASDAAYFASIWQLSNHQLKQLEDAFRASQASAVKAAGLTSQPHLAHTEHQQGDGASASSPDPAALPAQPVAVKPLAWRWKWTEDDPWQISDHLPSKATFVQPLYPEPPAPSQQEGVTEVLARIRGTDPNLFLRIQDEEDGGTKVTAVLDDGSVLTRTGEDWPAAMAALEAALNASKQS